MRTLIFSILALLAFQNLHAQMVTTPAENPPIVLSTVPIIYFQRLIFLEVSLNGTNGLLFLLDTGANTSAVDDSTGDKLGLTTSRIDSVEGSAGVITVPMVTVGSLSVESAIVNNLELTKYSLAHSLAPPGRKLDGILGTDFMKHFIITIDFRDSVITLADRLPEIVGEAIDLELDNGIPRIKAVINGTVSTWFRYDSGSSLFDSEDIYLNTTEGVLAELLKTDSTLKPSAHFSGTGVGGTVRLAVYKTDSVTMNELTINNPNLIIQPPQGYFARPDAVGFFGNNLMEKFRQITLDFKGKKMYLIKRLKAKG